MKMEEWMDRWMEEWMENKQSEMNKRSIQPSS